MGEDAAHLAHPEIQARLISEALLSAGIGFLVWDDDRRYVAANDAACRILGAEREQLLGLRVGAHTHAAEEAIAQTLKGQTAFGRAHVERVDGSGPVEVTYVTFPARSAGLPWMATVIWPTEGAHEIVLRKESP